MVNNMNERIRELAEKAREYANSKEPYEKIKNKAWIDVYDEKFAELIVREVFAKIEDERFDVYQPVRESVMKHFGVEE
jgi:dihydroxyacetone kinase-like predicted kinase